MRTYLRALLMALSLSWGFFLAVPLAAQTPVYPAQFQGPAQPQEKVRRLPAADHGTALTAQQPVGQGVRQASGVSAPSGSTHRGPQPPFELTAEQQAQVDQVLQLWETESDKISRYKCSFVRYEYDSVFLEGGDRIATTVSKGRVSYIKPDKGQFRITELERYNSQTKQYDKQAGDPNERWVCTGAAVFEFDAPNKQLKKYEIPPDMQGKGIADGPLPFLFGAKADKLRRRYFIRISHVTEEEIWLDVYPRYQADAANYSRVEVILNRSEFLPGALQVYTPNGKQRTAYVLGKASVNNLLDSIMPFQEPRTPLGWKLLVEEAPRRESGPQEAVQRSAPVARRIKY